MNCFNDCYSGIELCSSFAEFLERINSAYSDLIAFKSYQNQWTYRELYTFIYNIFPYFALSEKQYFCINIDSPFYFCAVFFAITISGKVALLGSKDQFSADFLEQVEIEDVQCILKKCDTCCCPVSHKGNEISIIALSSGTTSVSKGVMLSQFNLLSDTFAGAKVYGYPRGAVYLNVLPYNHLFGIVADMLGPLSSGGTICFSDNKLNMFKDMQLFKPTHMNLPPAIIYTIEKMVNKTQNASHITGGLLRKIMCAGARINESTIYNLKEHGIEIYTAYGLTECSPCISINSSYTSKIGSVGKVLPCCEVKIVDDEIIVRGDNVMLGYWNDDVSTKSVICDGWLHTGDLGYIDNDGFLFLTGRKSNIIVLENGEKVIPEIIEADLNGIDGIEESLVTSFDLDNRILISVTIVTLNKNQMQLMRKIELCTDKYGITNRLNNIVFSKEPLKKNKMGKVLRNRS